METVRNRDAVRIDFRRSSLHIQDALMTTDAIGINLVKLGGKTRMLPVALQRKDIDAWHEGMTRCMALRAVNLGVHGRLLPERRFPLLMVTGNAEFLLGRGIGGQSDGRVEAHYGQDPP
jgi:hypothetical protein